MLYKKITIGWVEQLFNEAGEFVSQQFYAGDEVQYESADGEPINADDMPLHGSEYHTYLMDQSKDS